ncbi:hypothetical protein WALSEDRAFT_59041 [Wallemia mellicola CBS 633.66]|uniref:Uncharacterized protein n=1 Tax=Wallemia mellicola (strain ATCC MYA-4683 / CBS 633.66) TaxID=671144 RepID=I4YJ40_WALMC|nr:hypothetical protein WALSEDRAFT_59041 [Wallemia mellicola CBS 633.66]EIM23982.1 hypothetical protein WALSEDRAFT_59041 [Wallemia mellicola CBS 633.66]|eukprot:XP_006955817.1 hypothetical protein WALSEDRAFT_59041 [Wallemia mellicola CBS 633.66]
MAEEYEDGPDPFMVDLGEGSQGNLLEESHRMESVNQMQSGNSLAFELAAAFGGSSTQDIPEQEEKPAESSDIATVNVVEDNDLSDSSDESRDVIDSDKLDEYNKELNNGIEMNAGFLKKLKDIDSGLPLLESTATVIVKRLVETAKIRDDQSRQLWELDKELSKEDDWTLSNLDALDDDENHQLDIIPEDEEDSAEKTEKSEKSSIPSLEGLVDDYIQESLTSITEISQISTASLNESSRKTRSMKTMLISIKGEEERTERAKDIIQRLENKSKLSIKQLSENILSDFTIQLNKLNEWVNVQRLD